MSYASEPEQEEEEDSGSETFEGLTVEEGILIASSSENIGRMGIYGDKKKEYRKIVEKLMRNTGILCRDDMNIIQKRHLKKKVITDFRRQVVPRPQRRYNVGGTLDED